MDGKVISMKEFRKNGIPNGLKVEPTPAPTTKYDWTLVDKLNDVQKMLLYRILLNVIRRNET